MSTNPPAGGWPPSPPPGAWDHPSRRSPRMGNVIGLLTRHRLAVGLTVAGVAAAVTFGVVTSTTAKGQPHGASAPSAASSAPGSAPELSTCTIYAQQHDGQVVISPGDKSQCDELIKDLAGGDAFWSYTPNGQALNNLQQACDMTSPDGTYEAVVLDESGGFIGQDVCSGMASAGWTASQHPGPLAQQIAQQAGQEQQAQASASAAAAQEQQVANLQQSLSGDIEALAQDASSLENDTSLADDIKSMKTDLVSEQQDYATVQSDDCSSRPGDAGTVDGDAGTVDGDLGTIQGDISSLQNNSVSSDVGKVQADVSKLKDLGASPDTDPSAALAAGKKALADMNNAITWARQQAQQLDGQAHQIAKEADTLASGC